MQEKYPLVSILIPCFNHEQYVKESLNSVLEDTYPHKEIIIINDGSSDNSDWVIREWIKGNQEKIPVNYLKRQNKGVCATLNELVSIAKGKYVLLLASDDALYGNTITERVEILENREKDNKFVLVSDAMVVDNDNNILMQSSMADYNRGNKAKYYSEKGILEEVILNPSISGATVLINKSIYKKIGMYPEGLATEDWYFHQRAASIYATLFWDKVVSLYRVHGLNSSGNTPSKQYELIKAFIITFYKNVRWFPTFRFKYLAITQLFKYAMILLYINLKKALSRKIKIIHKE